MSLLAPSAPEPSLICTPLSFPSALFCFISSIFFFLISSARVVLCANSFSLCRLAPPSAVSPAHSFHPRLTSILVTYLPRVSVISFSLSASNCSMASSASWAVTNSPLWIASSGFSSPLSTSSLALLIRGLMVVLKFYKSVLISKVTAVFCFLILEAGSSTSGTAETSLLAAFKVYYCFSRISP